MANKKKKSQTQAQTRAQTQAPPEPSASPLSLPPPKEDLRVNKHYKESLCGKLLDELNESDFEEIHTCQIKRGGIKCNAPYFCHSSKDPHPQCTFTKEMLIGDNLTIDGNCVFCLAQFVVCKPFCHLPLHERERKFKRKRAASLSIDGKLLSEQSNLM